MKVLKNLTMFILVVLMFAILCRIEITLDPFNICFGHPHFFILSISFLLGFSVAEFFLHTGYKNIEIKEPKHEDTDELRCLGERCALRTTCKRFVINNGKDFIECCDEEMRNGYISTK